MSFLRRVGDRVRDARESLATANEKLNEATEDIAGLSGVAGTARRPDNTVAAIGSIPPTLKGTGLRSFRTKPHREASLRIIRPQLVGPNGEVQRPGSSGEPVRDFIIQQIQVVNQEKISLQKTFGSDPDFVFTFGADTRIYSFSGMLRNEDGRGNWVDAFQYAYDNYWRAEKLVEAGHLLRLTVDTQVFSGYMLNIQITYDSNTSDVMVPFAFTMLIRQQAKSSTIPWMESGVSAQNVFLDRVVGDAEAGTSLLAQQAREGSIRLEAAGLQQLESSVDIAELLPPQPPQDEVVLAESAEQSIEAPALAQPPVLASESEPPPPASPAPETLVGYIPPPGVEVGVWKRNGEPYGVHYDPATQALDLYRGGTGGDRIPPDEYTSQDASVYQAAKARFTLAGL